tara:strand:- start:62 stop:1249 length:1188 start_codon:yes stop_codon:yes gene_type:complete
MKKYLFEEDRKKLSKKSKIIIEEAIKKNKKIKITKYFDIWSSIAIEAQRYFWSMYYCERAKPWGYNRVKNSLYLYNKFIEDNLKNPDQNLYNLLNLSSNKSLKSTGKERKIPFKQKVFPDEMNKDDWYYPPGNDVYYSNTINEKNPYSVSYYRKTKIPFFKGLKDQEKFIIDKKWRDLYVYGFIYGYILSWQNFVIVNWSVKKKDDDKNFPDTNIKLTKVFVKKNLLDEDTKKIFLNYTNKYLKIEKDKSEKIFSDILASIYDSKLSIYLNAKKENYFTFREREISRTISEHFYEQVGTSEFLEDVLFKKDKTLGTLKEGRYYNTVLNSRFDDRKKGLKGSVYNYEQFLLYTMYLEYISPLDFSKLKINESDIFLRFAINRGKDEFLDYAFNKIF